MYRFSITNSTNIFWKLLFEVNILVKTKIINISKNTIKFERNTDNNILRFFFEVLVIFETFKISRIKVLSLFTFLTILLKQINRVNNS